MPETLEVEQEGENSEMIKPVIGIQETPSTITVTDLEDLNPEHGIRETLQVIGATITKETEIAGEITFMETTEMAMNGETETAPATDTFLMALLVTQGETIAAIKR